MATPFTDDEQTLIQQRLAERGITGTTPCPLCHHTEWTLGSDLVTVATARAAGLFGNMQAVYPCVALFCGNCGDMHLLSLENLGLSNLADLARWR